MTRRSSRSDVHEDGSWDAVVVGGGPGGASSAYWLARKGRRVLVLDRREFPRDKSCGDGLTPHALRLLDHMGVLGAFASYPRVAGVRVIVRGRGSRVFPYSRRDRHDGYGLVVPRLVLDEKLLDRAVEAGAVLREGWRATRPLSNEGRVVGVAAIDGLGQEHEIRASIVIAADGAASAMARACGLRTGTQEAPGTALRVYLDSLEGLDNLLDIFLPLTDSTDDYVLPSYGWVFPLDRESANVGVGLFQCESDDTVRRVYDRFLDDLVSRDHRFRRAQPRGKPFGAPLRFDFTPETCAAPGVLLVGDAAGLISPFTGEGISYALESGRIAAETVDRCLRLSPRSPPFDSDYRVLMERHFIGHFETGRLSARRHLLVWHVLESTFLNERPIFNLLRRIALIPEGQGGVIADESLEDLSRLVHLPTVSIRDELFKVGAVLVSVLRADWPFLARMTLAQSTPGAVTFRPSLFVLLAGCLGNAQTPELVQIGAALDLGYLSFLSQSSLGDDRPAAGQPGETNWGEKFAVLIGDFLLAKAYELLGRHGAQLISRIGSAISRTCAATTREFAAARAGPASEREHLEVLEAKIGTLLELPCALGAEFAGAAWAAPAMASYGRNLGVAYALVEDVLCLETPERLAESPIASDLFAGVLSLPIIRALERGGPLAADTAELLLAGAYADLGRRLASAGLLDEARTTARRLAEDAIASLGNLPESPVTRALERLADYAVSRRLPEQEKLADMFRTEPS